MVIKNNNFTQKNTYIVDIIIITIQKILYMVITSNNIIKNIFVTIIITIIR